MPSSIPITAADHRHMHAALDLARKALERGDFPVGCVIVHADRVVAAGERIGTSGGQRNEIDHAEMLALRRLEDQIPLDLARSQMTLYATLEPCLMCWAAIMLAGIGRVVYAYEDAMGGGTACRLQALPPLYRQRKPEIDSGLLRNQSLALFKRFFSRPDNDYWRGSFLEQYTLTQQ